MNFKKKVYFNKISSPTTILTRSKIYNLDLRLKIAIGNENFKKIRALFNRSINLHNNIIAGSIAPIDEPLWLMNNDICKLIDDACITLFEIGKLIGTDQKNKSSLPEEALLYLHYQILIPIDEFIDINYEQTRLRFFFSVAIDLLVGGFWSTFGYQYYNNDICKMDINKLSISGLLEKNMIIENWQLYFIDKFITSEMVVETLNTQLKSTSENLKINKSIKKEMINDIFELIPLYIKGWSPNKHVGKLSIDGIDFFMYLSFTAGCPTITLSPKEFDDKNLIVSHLTFRWVPGNNQFYFVSNPLIDKSKMNNIEAISLSFVHKTLMQLYVKRKKIWNKQKDNNTFTFEIHLAELDDNENFSENLFFILEGYNNDISKCQQIGIPSIRLSYFVKIMLEKFQAKISNGKGSELKIWIPGKVIFIQLEDIQ
ncbi:hypothetical protein C0W42_22260 [Photobacterium kishitanii]|nr:hypothetical protein C0W42_22260 [Photobacterium kishitanii]